MENANVLGRLLAHMDVLSMALTPKPDAHFTCIKVIRNFEGDITETVLDPRVNRHCSTVKEQGKPIPDSVFDEQWAKKQCILDEREDANVARGSAKPTPPYSPCTHASSASGADTMGTFASSAPDALRPSVISEPASRP